MGFGKLFIGCFIAYVARIGLGNYGAAAILTGYIVMLWGIRTLTEYEKTFRIPLFVAPAVVLISLLHLFSVFDEMFLWELYPSFLTVPLELCGYALECAYLLSLLLAVRRLARDVGLEKLSASAIRAVFFVCLYYLYQYVVVILSYANLVADAVFLTQLSLALHLVCAVLLLLLFFGCYRQICPEGEEDMTPKPSRFAFINRMREKQEEKERLAQEKTETYLHERRERKKDGNMRKKRK